MWGCNDIILITSLRLSLSVKKKLALWIINKIVQKTWLTHTKRIFVCYYQICLQSVAAENYWIPYMPHARPVVIDAVVLMIVAMLVNSYKTSWNVVYAIQCRLIEGFSDSAVKLDCVLMQCSLLLGGYNPCQLSAVNLASFVDSCSFHISQEFIYSCYTSLFLLPERNLG